MPLTFPIQLFNPSSVKPYLTGRTIASPPSLSGVTQVLRTDGGGYWTVTLSGIVLRTEDQVRAWNAWDATLQGGVTRVNVPIASVRYAPRGQAGRKAIGVGNLRDTTDDPYFPEAVAYGNPVVIAKTAGASALRATTMSLTIVQGGMIKGGEAFSIDHPTMGRRLYSIARVLSRTGTTANVMISPPLREGVGSGVSVDFDWPSFEAVLVPEVDLAPELFNGRADVSISFREAF